jgi:hypothetical protein
MGFETVVRPAVFPNIRPSPARLVPIADAPDKGLAVITGGSNRLVDLPYTENHSWSRNRSVEVKRTYDKARVYYTRPDGTFDTSKYWEFEVLRSIEYLEDGKNVIGASFAPLEHLDNIEVVETNLTRKNPLATI